MDYRCVSGGTLCGDGLRLKHESAGAIAEHLPAIELEQSTIDKGTPVLFPVKKVYFIAT